MKLPKRPPISGALTDFWHGLANAYYLVFEHEEQASLRKHIRRGETRILVLADALKNITLEMSLYARSANVAIRDSILELVKECEANLRQMNYLEVRIDYRRPVERHVFTQSEADHVDRLTDSLTATIEKMLAHLRGTVRVTRPIDAYRARRVIHQGDLVLMAYRAQKTRQPSYYLRARAQLLKATQVLRRIAVGLGPIPLVFLFHRHAHPKLAKTSLSRKSLRLRRLFKRKGRAARSFASR